MSLCRELSYKDDIGIGSFKVSLMDNVYKLDEEKLKKYSKVEGF